MAPEPVPIPKVYLEPEERWKKWYDSLPVHENIIPAMEKKIVEIIKNDKPKKAASKIMEMLLALDIL